MAASDKYKGLHLLVDADISGMKKAINQATTDIKGFERTLTSINQRIKADPTDTDAYVDQLSNIGSQIKEIEELVIELQKAKEKLDNNKAINKNSEGYQYLAKTLNQYEKKLADLKTTQKEYNSQLKYSDSYIDLFYDSMKKSSDALKNAEIRYKAINEQIKQNPKNLENYTNKQQRLNEVIEATSKRLEELEGTQKALSKLEGIDKTSKKYIEIQDEIDECKNKLDLYKQEQEKLPKQVEELRKEMNYLPTEWEQFNSKLETTTKELDLIVQATEGLSKAFSALTVFNFKNAIDYESSVAEIKKVITDLKDDTIESLKEIAVETGNEFSNIAEVASLGATLGIAQKDIATFTKTMVDLNTATSGAIDYSEGSKSVARFLNVMEIGTDEASNFGSALTYVGDQFAATADEILEVSTRMAGLKTIAGVDQYDLIGLAAEMKNIGLSSESSSTAITRVFMTMNNAVANGKDSLVQYAEVAGMSAQEFSKAWKDNAMDAFLSFVDGIDSSVINEISDAIENNTSKVEEYAEAMGMSKAAFVELFNTDKEKLISLYADSMEDLSDESESASTILDDLGLTNVRTAETLLKLAGNGDVVREAISDANKAWSENTALVDKADTVYGTVESRYKALYEKAKQLGAGIAEDALPVLEDLIETGIDILDFINKMPSSLKNVITAMLLVGTSVTKVTKTLASSFKSLKSLNDIISNVAETAGDTATGNFQKLCKSISGSGGVTALLSKALPVACVAAGAALSAIAISILKTKNGLQNLKDELSELKSTADNDFAKSLRSIAKEYVGAQESIEEANRYSSQLEFKNGSVDKTTEAYQKLNEIVEEYNSLIGDNGNLKLHINEVTGELEDQEGQVIDLQKAYENLRIENERSAWLEANQESFDTALSKIQESIFNIAEKKTEIMTAAQELINAGTYSKSDIEFYVENWGKASELIGESKHKFVEMDQYMASANDTGGIRGMVISLYDYENQIKECQEVTSQYYDVANADADELESKLRQYSSTSYVANISYDKEDVDSIINAINVQQQYLNGLIEDQKTNGNDWSAEIDSTKEKISQMWNEASEASALYKDAKSKEDEANKLAGESADTASQKQDSLKTDVEETTSQVDLQKQSWINLAKEINNVPDSKHTTYTIDKVTREYTVKAGSTYKSAYQSASGGSGGYFGSLLSKIPSVARVNNLAKDIGRTIGNSRQAQAMLASGGYNNSINLNATFSINNTGKAITQSMSKQMARQMLDYINEGLGKGI